MVQRIKTLQRLAGMDDGNYRALLSGYGASSCKELTITDAHKVISFLQKLVNNNGLLSSAKRVSKHPPEPKYRLGMATQKQLNMLAAMWAEVSVQPTRAKRDAAFLVFLKKKFNRISVEHIEREMVGRIVKVLQAMQTQKP